MDISTLSYRGEFLRAHNEICKGRLEERKKECGYLVVDVEFGHLTRFVRRLWVKVGWLSLFEVGDVVSVSRAGAFEYLGALGDLGACDRVFEVGVCDLKWEVGDFEFMYKTSCQRQARRLGCDYRFWVTRAWRDGAQSGCGVEGADHPGLTTPG